MLCYWSACISDCCKLIIAAIGLEEGLSCCWMEYLGPHFWAGLGTGSGVRWTVRTELVSGTVVLTLLDQGHELYLLHQAGHLAREDRMHVDHMHFERIHELVAHVISQSASRTTE